MLRKYMMYIVTKNTSSTHIQSVPGWKETERVFEWDWKWVDSHPEE